MRMGSRCRSITLNRDRIGVWTSTKPRLSKKSRRFFANAARRTKFSIGAEDRHSGVIAGRYSNYWVDSPRAKPLEAGRYRSEIDRQVGWGRRFGGRRFGDIRWCIGLGKPDWPHSGLSFAMGLRRSGLHRKGLDQADRGRSVGVEEDRGKGKRSRLGFAKQQRDWVGGSCRRAGVAPIGHNRNWLGVRYGLGCKNSLLGQGGGLGKVR